MLKKQKCKKKCSGFSGSCVPVCLLARSSDFLEFQPRNSLTHNPLQNLKLLFLHFLYEFNKQDCKF